MAGDYTITMQEFLEVEGLRKPPFKESVLERAIRGESAHVLTTLAESYPAYVSQPDLAKSFDPNEQRTRGTRNSIVRESLTDISRFLKGMPMYVNGNSRSGYALVVDRKYLNPDVLG